jgi:phosphonate transport system ATP-binding protein
MPAEMPSDRNDTSVIVVSDLCKSFNGRMVLDRISCSIRRGEFTVLLGPSGGGKSTLFRCLTRLIEPDSGKVVVDGTDVTGLTPRALTDFRRQVGFIFQQFNLVKRFNALDNVLAALSAAFPCCGHYCALSLKRTASSPLPASIA